MSVSSGWWLSAAEREAILLSAQVASVAVVGSLPLGIATGWWLARTRSRFRVFVETAVNLPLVVPPVVTGYLLLVLLGREGLLGGPLHAWFGIRIVFTWTAAAIASAVVAFPLMVRTIRVAFAQIDPRLESAARTLGAGPFDAFATVSLPLARPGIVAGAVLAFARSLGEFGATIMIAGSIPGETRTIPLYLYDLLESPREIRSAWRIVAFSIAISFAALLVADRFDPRPRRESEADRPRGDAGSPPASR